MLFSQLEYRETSDAELIQCESEAFDSWAVESEITESLIKNVLLCGNKSKNGYGIPSKAFGDDKRVKELYSERHVFVNHAPKPVMTRGNMNEIAGRELECLAGVIINPRLVDGRPYGDIDTAGCPKGELLRQLATSKVRGVGLSHVAKYRWASPARHNVESVEKVLSVDVVTRPATTDSFTEQTGPMEQELIAAKANVTRLETELATKSQALTAAETRIATLAAEQVAAKAKLDEYEAEATRRALADTVNTELTTAGLDPANKDICGAVFIESLMSLSDAGKRQELITDRVNLIGIKAESTSKLVSGVRKPIGNKTTAATDVVAEALSSTNLLV